MLDEIRVQDTKSFSRDRRGRKQILGRLSKPVGVGADHQGEDERPLSTAFGAWATKTAASFEEEVSFSFEQDNDQIMVKVLHQKTGEVLRQILLSEIVEAPKDTRGLIMNQAT